MSGSQPSSSSAQLDPWERVGDVWENPELNEESQIVDYDSISPEEAGQAFADYLIFLKHTHVLSAVQASLLAFWSSKAGACGFASNLAYPPEQQSGKYSRHWDSALGVERNKYYKLVVPQNARMCAERVLETIHTNTVPDAFQQICDEYQDLKTSLDSAMGAGLIPPNYASHPVVVGSSEGEVVLPLELYVDGLGITRRDGCVAFFCIRLCRRTRENSWCYCARKIYVNVGAGGGVQCLLYSGFCTGGL